MQNTAYSQTVSASGGISPYTYAVTSGSLPTGISLNSSTGVISGTPSGTGTSSFTVTATDAHSYTGSQAYSVTIASGNCSGYAYWGSACYAYVSSLANGGNTPVTNAASGYTGSGTAYCTTGSLSASGSCSALQCSAGTATWGAGCSAPVGALNYGANTGVTNTATGYTGSATVTCNNGSYSYSNTSCTATCGGTSVGGYCWYAGAIGASCTTTCASHGGYNAATLSYAGSGGTDANCTSVEAALGWGIRFSGDISLSGLGCFSWSGVGVYLDTLATTADATWSNGARACACNN